MTFRQKLGIWIKTILQILGIALVAVLLLSAGYRLGVNSCSLEANHCRAALTFKE
jgi:hypothetical protein